MKRRSFLKSLVLAACLPIAQALGQNVPTPVEEQVVSIAELIEQRVADAYSAMVARMDELCWSGVGATPD